MKKWFTACLLFVVVDTCAQTIEQKLDRAWKLFSSDSQLSHASLAFCVLDGKTGKPIFEKNGRLGLAPASTQKIFTSIAAMELLGNNYRFKTALGYLGNIKSGTLDGSLLLLGSGDPTLGSWRWPGTKDSVVLNHWVSSIRKAGIQRINGGINYDASRFSYQAIPDGWIWQDIGNYYGAGAFVLNWKENQSDKFLHSGKSINDPVDVAGDDDYINELRSAAPKSGDNAYAYLPVGRQKPLLKGTIPVNEKNFSISVSEIDPIRQLITDLTDKLSTSGVPITLAGTDEMASSSKGTAPVIIHQYLSPSLDSINFYFLRKSVNLYGEALVKGIAWEKSGWGDTEKGLEIVRNFYADKGFDKSSLKMIDGSGLSPQNRVTAEAMARALQYAKKQSWFGSFYYSLPEYNGMKMKSGSIGGVRAYAGYHKATDGKEYTFSIIVNNFDESATEVIRKMYKLLDVLK